MQVCLFAVAIGLDSSKMRSDLAVDPEGLQPCLYAATDVATLEASFAIFLVAGRNLDGLEPEN